MKVRLTETANLMYAQSAEHSVEIQHYSHKRVSCANVGPNDQSVLLVSSYYQTSDSSRYLKPSDLNYNVLFKLFVTHCQSLIDIQQRR
jgi:hypothetical protein